MSLTVVQVLPALEGGGVERGTVEIAEELVRRGHRAVVVASGGRLAAELQAAGAEHVPWALGRKSPLTLRFIPRLRRLLDELQADILHARSRIPAWVAYLAWRGMDPQRRPRFITSVHGLYSVNPYSEVMLRGERVIAVSEAVRRYIVDHYPATDAQRIQVIPRGVDPRAYPHGYRPPEAWLRDWRAAHPQLGGGRILTLPGRLTRLKGHEDFLRLLARLRDRGRAVVGVAVGGGRAGYRRELEREARRLGLAQCMVFAGHRGDLREVMAASDLVLSLSRRPESFGRTTAEALSLGIPVVGYDHGGVGETLAAAYPEGRVPLGDLDALEARVKALLDHPPAVPRGGVPTLQAMLDATLALYASVVSRRHGDLAPD